MAALAVGVLAAVVTGTATGFGEQAGVAVVQLVQERLRASARGRAALAALEASPGDPESRAEAEAVLRAEVDADPDLRHALSVRLEAPSARIENSIVFGDNARVSRGAWITLGPITVNKPSSVGGWVAFGTAGLALLLVVTLGLYGGARALSDGDSRKPQKSSAPAGGSPTDGKTPAHSLPAGEEKGSGLSLEDAALTTADLQGSDRPWTVKLATTENGDPVYAGWTDARSDDRECAPLIDVLNAQPGVLAKPVGRAQLRQLEWHNLQVLLSLREYADEGVAQDVFDKVRVALSSCTAFRFDPNSLLVNDVLDVREIDPFDSDASGRSAGYTLELWDEVNANTDWQRVKICKKGARMAVFFERKEAFADLTRDGGLPEQAQLDKL
ncbi:hypothetical protein [Streptomyces sp. NPDC013455]|uniref:hypothetical protein n=1 Tax=Streptomyces sp. NPDC013455 TaxID=3155605 RepID=UPI0033DCF0B9